MYNKFQFMELFEVQPHTLSRGEGGSPKASRERNGVQSADEKALCIVAFLRLSPAFLFRPLRGHLPLGGRDRTEISFTEQHAKLKFYP